MTKERDQDQDAERAVQDLHPDVVVLDVTASDLDPVRVIGRLKEQHPDLKVLVLTGNNNSKFVASLITTYTRDDPGADREQTQRAESQAVEPDSSCEQDDEDLLERLTPREREVLTLIGKGADNSEIAWILSISKRTVETHVRNIYVKLGFKSRSQAVLWTVDQGLVRDG